jgi:hypothetical protein
VKAKGFQNKVVTLLDSILDNPQLEDVVGGIEGRRGGSDQETFLPVFLSDDEANAIADIEEAGNILTADNLSLMTGVLSESDIKIIRSLAGGALSRSRGEARFIKDVTALRDSLASTEVLTVDETSGTKVNDAARARLQQLRDANNAAKR